MVYGLWIMAYGLQNSIWFYSRDEGTSFNNRIANANDFRSFEYKAKLLGTIVADGVNGILRKITIAVPLKYLSNFWRSLKMPLTNFKLELKLKWAKHYVLT